MRKTAHRLRQARAAIARRRWTFFSLLSAGLIVLSLAGWPFVSAHLKAVAVLQLVSGKPVPRIVGDLVAVPITTEDHDFQTESGTVRGRLYLPQRADKQSHVPALIVLHGVHHLGIDEPRLEAFAAAMASCGIEVMTPELPGIKDYHVDLGSMRTIGESAHWFAQQTGGPVGVMGLSFSGGLALVAAADPLYKPDFKFVLAVGSQDSLGRVAEYFRTDEDLRPDGTVESLAAHDYGPLVLEYEYLEDFVPLGDVAAIRAVLRAHLYEDKAGEVAATAGLDAHQKVEALAIMDARSPAARALLAASTAKHVQEMAGLSPKGRLRAMTTPVYLLHGQADNIIPAAETLWMANELPTESLKAMLVSPVISHVGIEGKGPGWWDQWRLVHFFALVMHAAGR